MSDRYTFGDNDRAAGRLALLADVYEPTTRRLLGELSDVPVNVAVDLGCGPGHSTELLHATVGASWVRRSFASASTSPRSVQPSDRACGDLLADRQGRRRRR